MKCIRCGTDSKKKDRDANAGKCGRCQHPFTFEPTTMDKVKFTDTFFAKVIRDISSNGTLSFTDRQFLYFLDKKLKRKSSHWLGSLIAYAFAAVWCTLFFGGFSSIFLGNNSFFIIFIIFNLLCIFWLASQSGSAEAGFHQRRQRVLELWGLGTVVLVFAGYYWGRSALLYSAVLATTGLLAIFLGIFSSWRLKNITDSLLVRPDQAADWLASWRVNNGSIDQLLPALESATQPAAIAPSNDVTNYSFDRLVVCDRPEIAQMLIANNFHFEHNCAILCVSGYPEQIFDTTMAMVRRNPDLQVFALHNCDPRGLKLVYELTNSTEWFAGSDVRIIDLGLLPRQVLAKTKMPAIYNSKRAASDAQQLRPQIRQSLSPQELAWLERGNYVELESFTPQQLIKILQRGIAAAQQRDADSGDDLIFMDGGGDGGFYSIDSFG
jgi:hypothetical protein